MIKFSSVVLSAIFLISVSSVYLANPPNNIPISSESALSELILAQLGLNPASTNQLIKQFIANNQLSLLNAAEQIAIVLTLADQDEIYMKSSFNITKKFVEDIGNRRQQISVHQLFDKSQEEIDIYTKENLQGKTVHQLKISPQELPTLTTLLNPHSHHKRTLQQTPTQSPTQDPTYIIKFFFSVLFIIVTLGSLAAIATMENKKDTLLYAKFIAEVHNR